LWDNTWGNTKKLRGCIYARLINALEIVGPNFRIIKFYQGDGEADEVEPDFAYGKIEGVEIKVYGTEEPIAVDVFLIHPLQSFHRLILNSHDRIHEQGTRALRNTRPRSSTGWNNQFANISEKERYINRTFQQRPRTSHGRSRGPTLAPIIDRGGAYNLPVASTSASDVVDPNSFDLTSIDLPALYSPTLANLASTPFPDEVETWLDNDDYFKDLANLIEPATVIESLNPVSLEDFCPIGTSGELKVINECLHPALLKEITTVSDMVTDDSECKFEEVVIAKIPRKSATRNLGTHHGQSTKSNLVDPSPAMNMTVPPGFVSRLPPRPTGGKSARIPNKTSVATSSNLEPVSTSSKNIASTEETRDSSVYPTSQGPEQLAQTTSFVDDDPYGIRAIVPDIMVMEENDLPEDSNNSSPGLDGTTLVEPIIDPTLASRMSPVAEERPTTSGMRPLSHLDSGNALAEIARYIEETRYDLPSLTPQNSPTEVFYGSKTKRLARLTSPRTTSNHNYQAPVTPTNVFTVPLRAPTFKGKEVDRTPCKFTSGFPPGLGFEKAAKDLRQARQLASDLNSLPVDQPLFKNITRPTARPTLSYDHLLPSCEIESYIGASALFCGNGILVDTGHINLVRDSDDEEVNDEEEMEEGEIRGRSEEVRRAGPQAGDSLAAKNPHVVAGLNGSTP
ncbi:hypothetical protein P7C70_g9178, partial [Phenoliferia sp. Uapishka_3]